MGMIFSTIPAGPLSLVCVCWFNGTALFTGQRESARDLLIDLKFELTVHFFNIFIQLFVLEYKINLK